MRTAIQCISLKAARTEIPVFEISSYSVVLRDTNVIVSCKIACNTREFQEVDVLI